MKRYGIDVDGVLADFNRAFVKAMHGAPEKISYVTLQQLEAPATWEANKELVGPHNWRWFWQTAAPTFRVFEKMPAYKYQLDALAKLPGETFLLTSLPEQFRHDRFAWLAHNFVQPSGVLFVDSPEEKAEFVNALGINVYVDDRIETLQAMKGYVSAGTLCVMDRSWNRHVVDLSITRIKSLEELL